MTNDERLAVVKGVAEALNKRGHKTDMIEAHLNTVDGTWVGVWVMPKPAKKKETKYVFRMGFSNTIEEHDLDLGAEKLADKVLDWLAIHGEASRIRSSTKATNEE